MFSNYSTILNIFHYSPILDFLPLFLQFTLVGFLFFYYFTFFSLMSLRFTFIQYFPHCFMLCPTLLHFLQTFLLLFLNFSCLFLSLLSFTVISFLFFHFG